MSPTTAPNAAPATRVLLTGFEPFGGGTLNPSWEAAKLIASQPPAGLEVATARISCVFGTAIDELRHAVAEHEPGLVLCLGLAEGRTGLTVERVAINVDDARLPDNTGAQPVDEPIVPGGPAAYFATLPIKACTAAVREAGLPANVSQTAGTFVCNHLFYGLMHLIATERPALRGGFVHVPYAPQQVRDRAEPSMAVTDIATGVRAILSTGARTTTDLRVTEGAAQ